MQSKRKKKKFFNTTVGRVLKGAASIVAPGLVQSLEGVQNVSDAVALIRDSTEIDDDTKIRLKEMVLEAYEAEVTDRMSARDREATVAASGGSDVLFKVVGFGITGAFCIIVAGALGLWEIPEGQQRLYDMAFGAVVAQMTAIVSYYFGSSFGSKQKTEIMKTYNDKDE